MIGLYGNWDILEDEEAPAPEIVYWFAKLGLLCERNTNGSFTVLNGLWDFRIVDGKCVAYTGKLTNSDNGETILSSIEKPKAMTRKQFDKMEPNFGC